MPSRRSFLATVGLLPIVGPLFQMVPNVSQPGTPETRAARITTAAQLRRGMVVTLHHPQTHPTAGNTRPFGSEGRVITEVLSNHFCTVGFMNVVGRRTYRDKPHFRDFQIISEAVRSLRKSACNWVEITGEKTEEEVQRMLADDCLIVR